MTDFYGDQEKNPKWPIFQNGCFSKSPILKIFLRKFHRLVLGLVGLMDAKGIDVAQPIWLSMAIGVVEVSREGYKIRKVFA